MNVTKTVEPLVWKFQEPEHFPCIVCREHKATKIIKLTYDEIELPHTIVACKSCSLLDTETLIKNLRKK